MYSAEGLEHMYKKHVSVRKGYIGHVSVRNGYIECRYMRKVISERI
jgi:hypothetical protein